MLGLLQGDELCFSKAGEVLIVKSEPFVGGIFKVGYCSFLFR